MTIRQTTFNDLETIYKIEEQNFAPDHYPSFVLRQFYDINKEHFLVATNENDTILGYVLGGVNQEQKGWVLFLATSPNHQGKGIGKALLNSLIDLYKEKSLTSILLTVHPKNTNAIGLYKKKGFQIISEDGNYYGDQSPRVIMELLLS